MRGFANILIGLSALACATPALAQDDEGQEIIVTASRTLAGYRGDGEPMAVAVKPAPALRLRRTADFAVQSVRIIGDTRDEAKRREEIYAMLKGAITLAGKHGVELATGDYIVEPLTLANYRNLTLEEDDNREDAEEATFLVKTPLVKGADAKAALDRITNFVKAVPAVGRAEIEAEGDLTLSVVGPDQYRGQIIDLVAADAAKTAAKFGPDFSVTASGLDRPVEWSRVGLTEVSLYLPVSYSVVPKP
ncbi:TonB-dependent receptor [Sphingomonas sp. 7/4-4]|uniref:TonB-dependent receptor n=1 Tax=Sphingomonas sp. 7/4-4 TaxID=3018446 RepID=UPI0022F406AB|nr:TonB-dependent receptor [Sphingomonas sp. 7/4-4]WBY08535.1 TonB-dependent receptor [Sphingomonas sp. 7/4-4]